jgi:hypothetical protein
MRRATWRSEPAHRPLRQFVDDDFRRQELQPSDVNNLSTSGARRPPASRVQHTHRWLKETQRNLCPIISGLDMPG